MNPFLRTALLAGSCAALISHVNAPLRAGTVLPEDAKDGGFYIGCIVYTFDHASLFDALEMTAASGAKVVELSAKPRISRDDTNAFDYNATPELVQRVKAKLAECHLTPVTYTVIPFPADEAAGRRVFEFCRTMRIRALVTESPELADRLEKLVKEFDVMVGFHDHPRHRNDDGYRMWDPNYVLALVKDRDPRMGSCADTGHWVRSGLKPVDCLRILKGRVICGHLKDLNTMDDREAHDVPYGTGVSDIAGILDELHAQGFNGSLSIEYEYHWDTSLPEVAQCIGFVRGYGAAKGWR